MDENIDQNMCHAKVGLLFLRDCGNPAISNCCKCSRPVCPDHNIETSIGSLCPECADSEKEHKNNRATRRHRTREQYYSSRRYRPYYYGRNRYYSDRDYNTFEDQEQEIHNSPDDDFSDLDTAGDFDTDDGFES